MAKKKTIHLEQHRRTVMRFDSDCIIELDVVDDTKVNIKLYNEKDGSVKKGSCTLKGEE